MNMCCMQNLDIVNGAATGHACIKDVQRKEIYLFAKSLGTWEVPNNLGLVQLSMAPQGCPFETMETCMGILVWIGQNKHSRFGCPQSKSCVKPPHASNQWIFDQNNLLGEGCLLGRALPGRVSNAKAAARNGVPLLGTSGPIVLERPQVARLDNAVHSLHENILVDDVD